MLINWRKAKEILKISDKNLINLIEVWLFYKAFKFLKKLKMEWEMMCYECGVGQINYMEFQNQISHWKERTWPFYWKLPIIPDLLFLIDKLPGFALSGKRFN